jgi:hypothetical protein
MTKTPDSSPTSITELLQRVHDAYADFQATIAPLNERTVTAPNTIGSWSIRDVVAHVGADELWMVGQLEALLRGEQPTAQSSYGDEILPPADIDLSTQDGRNAWQHERLARLSLAEVVEMCAVAHARLLAIIESFSDDQLTQQLTVANLGTTGHIRPPKADEHSWPLWALLADVTYKHYAEHAQAIRAVVTNK